MKKVFFVFFVILLTFPPLVMADCATVTDNVDLDLNIPCAQFSGFGISVQFDRYYPPASQNTGVFYTLSGLAFNNVVNPCAYVDSSYNISVSCLSFMGGEYSIYLKYDPSNNYWQLTEVAPADTGGNQKPVASSFTMSVDSSVPYFTKQLSATDPDGDVITYELVSPYSAEGYSAAYINPMSGMLYITHEPAGNDTFTISYRVTDGGLFSDTATVTVKVTYLSDDEKKHGKK